jgi:hypothetical protein
VRAKLLSPEVCSLRLGPWYDSITKGTSCDVDSGRAADLLTPEEVGVFFEVLIDRRDGFLVLGRGIAVDFCPTRSGGPGKSSLSKGGEREASRVLAFGRMVLS